MPICKQQLIDEHWPTTQGFVQSWDGQKFQILDACKGLHGWRHSCASAWSCGIVARIQADCGLCSRPDRAPVDPCMVKG